MRLYGIPETILAAVVPFPDARRRLQRRHPAIQLGTRRRPHRIARSAADQGRQHLRQARARGEADAVPGIPRHRGRRAASRSSCSRRWPRPKARSASTGPRARRSAAGCGRRATTSTGRSVDVARQGCARDRRLRADLAARRVRARNPEGHRGVRPHRADRRPRRRRQLPRQPCSIAQPQGAGRGRRLLERLVARALAMEGTCTGEHGVGRASASSWPPSTAPASPSCGRSRPRSIP